MPKLNVMISCYIYRVLFTNDATIVSTIKGYRFSQLAMGKCIIYYSTHVMIMLIELSQKTHLTNTLYVLVLLTCYLSLLSLPLSLSFFASFSLCLFILKIILSVVVSSS